MPEPRTRVKVRLIGGSGNAFAVMGKVIRAMRKEGVDEFTVQEYIAEATKGDYDNLLKVTMDYVEVL